MGGTFFLGNPPPKEFFFSFIFFEPFLLHVAISLSHFVSSCLWSLSLFVSSCLWSLSLHLRLRRGHVRDRSLYCRRRKQNDSLSLSLTSKEEPKLEISLMLKEEPEWVSLSLSIVPKSKNSLFCYVPFWVILFLFNIDLSDCFDFLFLVSFLLSQGGGMHLSKLGEKILSSIRSPKLLGCLLLLIAIRYTHYHQIYLMYLIFMVIFLSWISLIEFQ